VVSRKSPDTEFGDMKKLMNVLLIVAVAGLLLGTAMAQTAAPAPQGSTGAPPQSTPPSAAPPSGSTPGHGGPGVYDPGHPRVNEMDQRMDRSQDAIKNGVRQGTLTDAQARNLERGEQRIRNQESKDMAANGGHLTKAQQNQLNRAQNLENHKIRTAKGGGN
jgi:hypothetical protein